MSINTSFLVYRPTNVKQHKAVIGSLEANDPEFYKFLREEDQALLNFDDSSEEEDEVHQLPDSLVEKEVGTYSCCLNYQYLLTSRY